MYGEQNASEQVPSLRLHHITVSCRLVLSYMRYSPQESQPSLGNGIQREHCQFWGSHDCQDEKQHSNPFVPSQQ